MSIQRNENLLGVPSSIAVKSVEGNQIWPDFTKIYGTPSKIKATSNSNTSKAGVLYTKKITLDYPGISETDFHKFHELLLDFYEIHVTYNTDEVFKFSSKKAPMTLTTSFLNNGTTLSFEAKDIYPIQSVTEQGEQNNFDDMTQGCCFNVLKIKEITTSNIVGTGIDGISFIYDEETNKVTDIILSENFTPYLYNVKQLIELKEFHFLLANVTRTKTLAVKILAVDYTNSSDTFMKVSVEHLIKIEDINLLDQIVVDINASSINSSSKPLLVFQDFWYNSINSSHWLFREHSGTAQVVDSENVDLVAALGGGSAYLYKPSFIAPFDVKLIKIILNIENPWSHTIGPIGFGKHYKLNLVNSVSNAVSFYEFQDAKGSYKSYYKSLGYSDFGNIIIKEGESFFTSLKKRTRGLSITVLVEKI